MIYQVGRHAEKGTRLLATRLSSNKTRHSGAEFEIPYTNEVPNMLREVSVAAVIGVSSVLSGCASIVHGGPRPVSVASTPAGATVSIYDRDNTLVQTNTTPFVAQLSTK